MHPCDKILCAVDFSEATGQVAGYAATLARAMNAEVLAVYVAPTLDRYRDFQVSASAVAEFVDAVANGARQSMDACLKQHFAGLRAEGRVMKGYPPQAIVDTARNEGCGLIVMGTHGRQGLDRIIFGSVAEKVIKTSPVPVLSIKPLR